MLACATDCPVLPVHISGIRGVGRTLSALILSGQPEIRFGSLLHCKERDQQQLLGQIADYLNGVTTNSGIS